MWGREGGEGSDLGATLSTGAPLSNLTWPQAQFSTPTALMHPLGHPNPAGVSHSKPTAVALPMTFIPDSQPPAPPSTPHSRFSHCLVIPVGVLRPCLDLSPWQYVLLIGL